MYIRSARKRERARRPFWKREKRTRPSKYELGSSIGPFSFVAGEQPASQAFDESDMPGIPRGRLSAGPRERASEWPMIEGARARIPKDERGREREREREREAKVVARKETLSCASAPTTQRGRERTRTCVSREIKGDLFLATICASLHKLCLSTHKWFLIISLSLVARARARLPELFGAERALIYRGEWVSYVSQPPRAPRVRRDAGMLEFITFERRFIS